MCALAAAALPASARWRGPEIKLIDGTTVSMPDTPGLQACFPQNKTQRPGLGFPLARIVDVVSLSSGCVGAGNGEPAQLWRLLDGFALGDLVIADRAYSSCFLLAAMQQRGIDFVIREHQKRKNNPHNSRVLGPNDRLLAWPCPARPTRMDLATHASMPDALCVREVRAGKRLIVISLSDAGEVSADEIAWLYTRRR